MIFVLSSMRREHLLVRADQAIERAAGVAVDEREAADEAGRPCARTLALRKRTTMSVSVCAFGRCVNSQVVVVEVQRRRVGEGDHRQRFARARAGSALIGGWIHLRRCRDACARFRAR